MKRYKKQSNSTSLKYVPKMFRTLQDLQQQQVNLNEIEIHKASLLEIMFKDNHSKEVETL